MRSVLEETFYPIPREYRALSSWRLQLPVQIDASPDLQAPAQLLRHELQRLIDSQAVQNRGKTVVRLRVDRSRLRREEEYTLHTADRRIELSSHDVQGAFWAAHTLLALLEKGAAQRISADTWLLPGVAIQDYPQSTHRAFMIQGAWAGSEEAFRHHLLASSLPHSLEGAGGFAGRVI